MLNFFQFISLLNISRLTNDNDLFFSGGGCFVYLLKMTKRESKSKVDNGLFKTSWEQWIAISRYAWLMQRWDNGICYVLAQAAQSHWFGDR